jgi:hypothetical protein
MENEFVTYEQALALKELGFEWQTLIFFDSTTRDFWNWDYFHDINAPLKQQVFRFFREKYNQNSFIELVYQDGIKYDYVLYADKDEKECGNFGDGPFNTYEEAENACIDKLIEIAKQQAIS